MNTKHREIDYYQESLPGYGKLKASWASVCNCGHKEKDITELGARSRMSKHIADRSQKK